MCQSAWKDWQITGNHVPRIDALSFNIVICWNLVQQPELWNPLAFAVCTQYYSWNRAPREQDIGSRPTNANSLSAMANKTPYSYKTSVKSDVSDELINTYLVRPLAGLLVSVLYRTPITPNQVTVAATLVGLLSALLYSSGSVLLTVAAGILLWMKDLLDSADGQLARAKQLYSRSGRFLDSIGDFVVNAFVFAAITIVLFTQTGSVILIVLGIAGFAGITLRVSYHVFYQVSYLHLEESYALNRTSEEIREEDLRADRFTVRLQYVFQFLYGLQDRLMERLDSWCREGLPWTEDTPRQWFGDLIGLRMSGFLGMGTELFVLAVFSVMDQLEWYLYFNVCLQNGLWLATVLYRRTALASRLRCDRP